MSLLLSSLIEEALFEVIGLSMTQEVWCALEAAFSHKLKVTPEVSHYPDVCLVARYVDKMVIMLQLVTSDTFRSSTPLHLRLTVLRPLASFPLLTHLLSQTGHCFHDAKVTSFPCPSYIVLKTTRSLDLDYVYDFSCDDDAGDAKDHMGEGSIVESDRGQRLHLHTRYPFYFGV
ncbi:hypothetical protein Dimus_005461 [Dionaea muscipula]